MLCYDISLMKKEMIKCCYKNVLHLNFAIKTHLPSHGLMPVPQRGMSPQFGNQCNRIYGMQ